MRRWASSKAGRRHVYLEYLLAAPDLFHLLCRLAFDPEVGKADKGRLLAAIAYFVAPIDALSEGILGPAALVDDLALAAHVLHGVLDRNAAAVRRHWSGEVDIVELIEGILAAVDGMVGSGLWRRLRRLARR